MSFKIDIVIPVYNEEPLLEKNIKILNEFLHANLRHKYTIIIANNGSTDKTLKKAKELSRKYDEITYFHMDQKGRGGVIKRIWLESKADIVSYMDVDLSANLESFLKLVDSLIINKYDLAVGSRLMPGSKVKRKFFRSTLTCVYNMLLKLIFSVKKFSDAQCGIKVLTKNTADELLPYVKNQNWFFDSELLLLAEKKDFRIKNIPLEWVERPESKVNILSTIGEDITGILRFYFSYIK